MHKTLSGIAALLALVLCTGVAFAGGERLDSKDSKMTQPILEQQCNWTGFYLGAHVGYAGGDFRWIDQPEPTETDTTDSVLVDSRQSGFITGGQIGYNYQFRSFVIGAEGEFSYSDVDTSKFVAGDASSDFFRIRSDWQASAALRVGYAYHKWLFYAKGGAGFVQQRYSQHHAVSGGVDAEGGPAEVAHVDTFKADEERTAPLVGGGLEYAITCHWSAKVEYNHIFLGSESVGGTAIDDGVAEPEAYKFDMDQDSVRIGLNYKF